MSLIESKIKEKEELRRLRDRWLYYAFMIGALGLLNILTNISDLNVIYTHLGIKTGIAAYVIFLVICFLQGIRYHRKMKKIN